MRLLECPERLNIPPDLLSDLFSLSDYIVQTYNVYLPIKDLYRFWIYVSLDHQVLWLPVDYYPEGKDRDNFLIEQLDKYCEEYQN